MDGSRVVSDAHTLRVKSPLSVEEDEIADLYFGDEQGQLLSLLGSDSEYLKKGNEALDMILDRYGKHPLAIYARLVKGINASREFKQVTPDKMVNSRKRRDSEFVPLLNEVISASVDGRGLDNMSLNQVMRTKAKAQKAMGDEKGAQETLRTMVSIFEKKGFSKSILSMIEKQSQETLIEKRSREVSSEKVKR